MTLVLTFAAWMLLLLAGFGLMIHASGSLFIPHIVSFQDALWVAGSSLMTLGVHLKARRHDRRRAFLSWE